MSASTYAALPELAERIKEAGVQVLPPATSELVIRYAAPMGGVRGISAALETSGDLRMWTTVSATPVLKHSSEDIQSVEVRQSGDSSNSFFRARVVRNGAVIFANEELLQSPGHLKPYFPDGHITILNTTGGPTTFWARSTSYSSKSEAD